MFTTLAKQEFDIINPSINCKRNKNPEHEFPHTTILNMSNNCGGVKGQFY